MRWYNNGPAPASRHQITLVLRLLSPSLSPCHPASLPFLALLPRSSKRRALPMMGRDAAKLYRSCAGPGTFRDRLAV
eukprot:609560-Rhodomonas_salina.2